MFSGIAAEMSVLLALEHVEEDIDEEVMSKTIDFYFREAEQFIKQSDRITVPFEYEALA